MTYTFEFTVPGPAVGKGRPRVGRVMGHARLFTPEKTVAYESTVRLFASQALGGRPPIAGPFQTNMHITMGVPASWSKKKRAAALAGQVLPTTKPDIDNVVKAVFDALNGVTWVDDVQCCSVCVAKRYGETPGVHVQVLELFPGADHG